MNFSYIKPEINYSFTLDNGEEVSLDNYDLVKMIKKNIPKKLSMMRQKKYDGYDIGKCKCECGAIIDKSLMDDEVNYCYKCGQKIDWSEHE